MIKVYLANRPPLKPYDNINKLINMSNGEIEHIVQETGNHWRKIFNVYAKIIFSLALKEKNQTILQYKKWQQYRDQKLLQRGSDTELHFNSVALKPALSLIDDDIRIIMGKAFAETLLMGIELKWLDNDFAINEKLSIIVCPYFDYRQLSNAKIDTLITLMSSLRTGAILRL